jgi:copper(I)-binding protein
VIQSRLAGALPRRLLLVAAAALVPVLAGCEAGNNAPTLSVRYTTPSAMATVGDLNIRNVFVLGAPLGRKLAPGQSASVFLALVNTGSPDKLLGITAPGTATSVTLPGGGVPVLDGHPVYYAGPAAHVVLRDLTRTVTSGSNIRLVLMFEKAGPVTMLVPVLPRAAQFTTLQPPASPSVAGQHAGPSATPQPSVAASASPSPTPSP